MLVKYSSVFIIELVSQSVSITVVISESGYIMVLSASPLLLVNNQYQQESVKLIQYISQWAIKPVNSQWISGMAIN